ncbi:hypothetical protein [Agathobacter rectalis]|jgi:hypothetical protein|uniref:hypothetical protein n=1 Tax=Agathobacter rectalis TaxID=39491 RepID=UPI0027D22F93|nr:hypothetical protein [Agathobacter rectalis]MDB8008316.1 hypothetical protein [Agathobacter rectalis]MDB8010748.1 hypothetical protein [Agathobacter rectalis]
MEKNHTMPILASYVTYKELSSRGNYKSPYQILAEFIKYIIYEKKLYAFSIGEIKSRVENEFEFYLPDAVLKSALKKIDFVTYDTTGNYCVNVEKVRVNGELKKYRNLAENTEISILEQLISFVEEKNYKLNNREKKELMRAFGSYLIDESNGNKYQEEISSFIIKKSDDKKITEYLNSVREGVILYTGLNYNIDEIGSLKKDLTLYLDMEVLFDIYGYNGEVFQSLALDLFKLARDANSKEKRIRLRYFEETKTEIDLFFAKAEEIVKGKVLLKDNVAMKAITNGCQDVSDISDRKADFYTKLRYSYGIIQDDRDSYYYKSDIAANLEWTFSEEEKKDQEVQFAVKMISHINKLRNNKPFYEYTESEAIFITETRKIQEYSRKMVDLISNEIDSGKKMVGYAISMGMITNILWYKLSKGFGNNDFPQNINSVLKAKIVLSNLISQNVSKKFDECKKAYQKGELDEQQLAARLLALREKAVKPEDINTDNLEDSLNFDSKHIERFEAERELHKAQLRQNKEQLEDYQSEIEKLKRTIQVEEALKKQQETESAATMEEKDATIQAQSEELKRYREKDLKKENRRKLIKKVGVFSKRICLRLIILLVIVAITYNVTKYVKADAANTVAIIVTVVGIFISCVDIVKNVYNDVFNNKEE